MSSIKQFNPGEKSWKIYAKELLSINGDDLILKPHKNNNLILEPSNGNVIVNSDISINGILQLNNHPIVIETFSNLYTGSPFQQLTTIKMKVNALNLYGYLWGTSEINPNNIQKYTTITFSKTENTYDNSYGIISYNHDMNKFNFNEAYFSSGSIPNLTESTISVYNIQTENIITTSNTLNELYFKNGNNNIITKIIANNNNELIISDIISKIQINGNIDISGNAKINNMYITNFANDSISISDKSFNNLSSSTNNTIFGLGSANSLTTGIYNTSIGNYVLYGLTNGNYNIGLGSLAAYNLTSGSNNIYIGYNILSESNNSNYEIVIGSNITGQGSQTNTIGRINQQTKSYLGYLKIGCLRDDSQYVEFAHNQLSNTNSYALAQQSDGNTYINAASDKKIHFRIDDNSNNEITYDGTTLDLSGITLDVNTINASQLNFNGLSTNIPTESGRLYKDSNNFLKISP
jgi:hypothetical protein